jgi:hypothetical protein
MFKFQLVSLSNKQTKKKLFFHLVILQTLEKFDSQRGKLFFPRKKKQQQFIEREFIFGKDFFDRRLKRT